MPRQDPVTRISELNEFEESSSMLDAELIASSPRLQLMAVLILLWGHLAR
jgi:hypothetical protein